MAISGSRRTERPSERAMSVLWQRSHELPEGLVAEDGTRLRVVYPGRASARAGPDFRDAVIADEGGRLLTGDVELHVNAPDWYSHGHHLDPRYSGVVLHVVLRPQGRARSRQRSGTTVPIASLPQPPAAADGPDGTPPDLGQPAEGPRPEVLDEAGDRRFLDRSRGFAEELARDRDGADQVAYRAILEALGYASNKRPFRVLADRVPVSLLTRLRREPSGTRLAALKALLVGTSGLLAHLRPPQEARSLGRMRRLLPRTRTMRADRWALFRVRPANHPVARMLGAAHLVERHIERGFARGLAVEVQGGDCRPPPDSRSLREALMVRPFIGPGRAGDVVVNVVLPFVHAFAQVAGLPALGRAAVDRYHAFPKLEENELTREARRIFGATLDPRWVRGARRQQGLIHLYRGMVGTRTAVEGRQVD